MSLSPDSVAWLDQLCSRFTQSDGDAWAIVDATHERCGTIWLGIVHRSSMGWLECPECHEPRAGYAQRVYAKNEEERLRRRWPGLDPIIHAADGSVQEGPPL